MTLAAASVAAVLLAAAGPGPGSAAEAREAARRAEARAAEADRCILEEAKKHARNGSEASEAAALLEALAQEKVKVMQELAAGQYCSRCRRTASEIERSERVSFAQHLDQVRGVAIPAPAELVNQRAADFDREIEQARGTVHRHYLAYKEIYARFMTCTADRQQAERERRTSDAWARLLVAREQQAAANTKLRAIQEALIREQEARLEAIRLVQERLAREADRQATSRALLVREQARARDAEAAQVASARARSILEAVEPAQAAYNAQRASIFADAIAREQTVDTLDAEPSLDGGPVDVSVPNSLAHRLGRLARRAGEGAAELAPKVVAGAERGLDRLGGSILDGVDSLLDWRRRARSMAKRQVSELPRRLGDGFYRTRDQARQLLGLKPFADRDALDRAGEEFLFVLLSRVPPTKYNMYLTPATLYWWMDRRVSDLEDALTEFEP